MVFTLHLTGAWLMFSLLFLQALSYFIFLTALSLFSGAT